MLRRRAIDLGWALFAVANLLAMIRWESWETIPFHFIWVSLTLLYGFRVWRTVPTLGVLGAVIASTATLILVDIRHGTQEWGEVFEVPLMSAMFLAMVWHAQRRQQAMKALEVVAESRASLLAQQERFLHDASHELRTPVTIARGHLELLESEELPEVAVAIDELQRIERIVDRLLLLAKADQPDFLVSDEIDLEHFLEDVFMRWSEVAPRVWRLGDLVQVSVCGDAEALRVALDALVENAVKYTGPEDAIEIRSLIRDREVVIEVSDEGCGIPAAALDLIFDRFGRADAARSRAEGGAGLGLSIVDAIAKAHGGRCTVHADAAGSRFSLHLPALRASAAVPVEPVGHRLHPPA